MLTFTNDSTQTVLFRLDSHGCAIDPGKTEIFPCPAEKTITISLRPVADSDKVKHMACLNLEAVYTIPTPADGTVFTITREKIQFDPEGSLDRFFLNPDRASTPVLTVIGLESLKRKFRRARVGSFFLEPLIDLALMGVIFYGMALVCAVIFGIEYLLLFMLGAYCLNLIANFIGGKLAGGLAKLLRVPKAAVQTMEENLAVWSEGRFLAGYYAAPTRTPFSGSVER